MAGIFDLLSQDDIDRLRAQELAERNMSQASSSGKDIVTRNMKQVGEGMRTIKGRVTPALEGAKAVGDAASRGVGPAMKEVFGSRVYDALDGPTQKRLGSEGGKALSRAAGSAIEPALRTIYGSAPNAALEGGSAGSRVGPAMREIFGERVPNAALEGPAAEAGGAAAKRGLLSRFMSVVGGPVSTGAQAALYSPELNTGEDELVADRNSQERQAAMNADPESANDPARYAADLSRRTLDAGMGRTGGTPSPYAMDYKAPQAAPQQDPEAVAQQVAQEKEATEAKRQVVEKGAVEALRTNQVSRPQLAEEVVKADLARKGETATPDELKSLVQQEATEMRTMDNKDLSKYVSYALIAGGIAAAFMDKSGKAGDAFSSGFNKQLDRNLVQQKMKAAQQQQEVENKLNTYKIGQKDKEISISGRNADTAERKTDGVLGNYATQAALGAERNNIARLQVGATSANAAASNGIRSAQLDLNKELAAQRQANADRDYKLDEQRVGILGQKANAGNAAKAPELSSKVASDMVEQVANEGGTKLSKAAQAVVTEQVRVLQKANPVMFAKDPIAAVRSAIEEGVKKETLKKSSPFWGSAKYEITPPK